MKLIGAIALGIAILGAAISSRKSPVPERDRALAGRAAPHRVEAPLDPPFIPPSDAPAPPRLESSIKTTLTPAADPAPAATSVHDPWRDLVSKVELMEDQKPTLRGIVTEREALLKETYGQWIRDGKSEQQAADAVREVFAQFDRKILDQLTGWQQAKYLEAREAGTIGRPMLVFQWGAD